MTHKTSKTRDKFHINLSDSSKYAESYKSFLEYEPLNPSDQSVSDASANSAVSTPLSQGSGSSAAPEIPEIQESTHQVPCGKYSIFDPDMKVPEFNRAVYLRLNEHSNWDTGITRPVSNRDLAKLLNVKCGSQVNRAIKWLIKEGWLKIEGQRKSDGTHFYRLVHHKCAPDKVPLDKDNRPQKCAVPMGRGSATALLAEGKITWRVMVDWFVKKVHSNWITGVVEMTCREANKLLRFSLQTICDNAKTMCEVGLLERLSEKCQASVFQLFPKPYPERRERADYKGKKPLPLIKDWYYSYNKRWRFHKDTLQLMKKDFDGKWLDTEMSELLEINPKIYKDFREYMDTYSSDMMENIRQLQQDLALSNSYS